MTSVHSRVIRYQGSLLAAAAGDALGWPQELKGRIIGGQKARDSRQPVARFSDWSRNAGSRFAGIYEDPVSAGDYSDDTQLICAVARACLAGGDWERRLRNVEFPAWRFYQRGGGRAVLNAASSWSRGIAPWQKQGGKNAQKENNYRQAGGNGVAMRIAPHVLAAISEKFEFGRSELAQRIVTDGLLTHGHPRALVGATAYGAAMYAALASEETLVYGALLDTATDGLIDAAEALTFLPDEWGNSSDIEKFAADWDATTDEMRSLLAIAGNSLSLGSLSKVEETLRDMGLFDAQIHGAGTVTTAGALYLASRSAARPISGLLDAAFARKADTDTLASMTGGILGAIHGIEWLGPLSDVQDASYLMSLGEWLCEGKIISYPVPTAEPERLGRMMQASLSKGRTASDKFEFPDGRTYSVIHQTVLQTEPPFGRSFLKLQDGQSVMVDQRLGDNDLPAELRRMPAPQHERINRTEQNAAWDREAIQRSTSVTSERNAVAYDPGNSASSSKPSENETVLGIADLLPQELALFDKQRNKLWFAELGDDLERISKKTGMSPAELLADTRFRAASVKALRVVREAISDDKVRTLSIAVSNSFKWAPFTTAQVNAFLNLLSKYEFSHLEILLACSSKSFSKRVGDDEESSIATRISATVTTGISVSLNDVELILEELVSDGLLFRGFLELPERHRPLTDQGIRFLTYCGMGEPGSDEG